MCQKQPLTSTNHASSHCFSKKVRALFSMISDSFGSCRIVDGVLSACLSEPRHDLDAGRFAAGKNVASGLWLVGENNPLTS
jgi:hypothetical protein